MWHLRPRPAGCAVIDLDLHTPQPEARPVTSEAETRSTKNRRHEEPGPSSAHTSKGQSELDKQRQESVATALQLYANPQEAGIKLLLPPLMDITDNPFTLCPTEGLATSCLHSKWAPFGVLGQLLDGLPTMQDSRHSSPSIDQPSDYKSIFWGLLAGPSGWSPRADEEIPHGQPLAQRRDLHMCVERIATPRYFWLGTGRWGCTRTPTTTKKCRTS